MSSEEIIDVQPTEHKENGETEAPAAIPQEQQQVHEEAKEVPKHIKVCRKFSKNI